MKVTGASAVAMAVMKSTPSTLQPAFSLGCDHGRRSHGRYRRRRHGCLQHRVTQRRGRQHGERRTYLESLARRSAAGAAGAVGRPPIQRLAACRATPVRCVGPARWASALGDRLAHDIITAPVVCGGAVCVSSFDGAVSCFDASNGQRLASRDERHLCSVGGRRRRLCRAAHGRRGPITQSPADLQRATPRKARPSNAPPI